MKYRKKLSKRQNKRRFNRGNKISSLNNVQSTVRRGGIRL